MLLQIVRSAVKVVAVDRSVVAIVLAVKEVVAEVVAVAAALVVVSYLKLFCHLSCLFIAIDCKIMIIRENIYIFSAYKNGSSGSLKVSIFEKHKLFLPIRTCQEQIALEEKVFLSLFLSVLFAWLISL
jgi:hypothetical protein